LSFSFDIPLWTVIIFILSHIFATIWWASKINTTMQALQKSIADIVIELKETRLTIFTKTEAGVERDSAIREHDAIWERIHFLEEQTK
jgi:hypothetical protein